MSNSLTEPPKRIGRSIGAVLLGILVVFVLSLGTDQIFHVLDVYPPWNQPMPDTGDNLLALAYRCVYAVIGGYVTAWFAPRNPIKHALILGWVGFVLATLGVIGAMTMKMGPMWYPIALVITAVPLSWWGGKLFANRARSA